MEITVIIPTYKPGTYLWECLDSLKKQTFSNERFEIVIVLNGCQEPWRTEIESYIKDSPGFTFKFIHTLTPGVSNARNLALKEATGEYIVFIDDDDFVSPTYLEELYKKAKPDIISLCYPLSFIDGMNKYEPFYITDDYIEGDDVAIPYVKARRYFSGPVYKMIHRDIIGNRRYNESFKNGEDSIFMFEISDKYKNVSFTSKNAVYYRRIREGSALLKEKSFSEIIHTCFNMIVTYSKLYFKQPRRYNFWFYFTRVLGAFHGAIEQIQFRKRTV